MDLRAKKNHNKKAKNEFLSDNLQFLYMLKCGAFTTVIYIHWILVDDFLVEKYSIKNLAANFKSRFMRFFFCNFKMILKLKNSHETTAMLLLMPSQLR